MKTCPKCKTTGIPDDANFCPECGYQIQIVEEKIFEVTNHTDDTIRYMLDGKYYELKPNEKIEIKTHPNEHHVLVARRRLLERNVIEFTGLTEGKYHYVKSKLGSLLIKKL